MKLLVYTWVLFGYSRATANHEQESLFPEITFDQQIDIYNQYCEIIEKESKNLNNFRDSKTTQGDVVNVRAMLSSYIGRTVLVIDLGGSSLKIAIVKCTSRKGENDDEIPEISIVRSEVVDLKTANDLSDLKKYTWHDWAAEKVKEFIQETEEVPETGVLCFSFEINQKTPFSATFVKCQKYWWFSTEGLENQNVTDALNKSIREVGLKITINGILNDSVATFMTGAYLGSNNTIGLVLGTGTNASYSIGEEGKIINSEWASFEVDKLISIDEISASFFTDSKTGEAYRPLEVLVAGMKFPEIVKAKLVDMGHTGDRTTDLTVAKIYEIVENNDGSKLDEFEEAVNSIFLSFKRRAYRILAPLILSAGYDPRDEFSLILNGTILGKEKDRELLKMELISFMKRRKLPEDEMLAYIYEKDASLIGSAFMSFMNPVKALD